MPQLLTNKYNLPDTLVKACKHDSHRVAGSISCSQLIDGPQVRLLKRMYNYEVDVVDNLYALMGTALHNILERANIDSIRKRAFILTAETIIAEAEKIPLDSEDNEKRAKQLKAAANYIFGLIPYLFPEIGERYLFELTLRQDFGDDMTLYGTFDLYDKETGILYDYKFCSVYQWIFPEAQKKWKAQTNVYAYLLDKEGYKVNGIKIIAFFRDWNDHSLIRNKDYPKLQIQEINVELGNPKNTVDPWQTQVLKYINFRLDLHRRAENGENIRCTGEDRWAKADEWAVKTSASKKALARFDNEQLAHAFIQENKHKYELDKKRLFLEYRPGDSMRCSKYCPVASVCPQRQEELKIKQQLIQANE